MNSRFLFVCALFLFGCATAPAPKEGTASTTRISIEVQDDAMFAVGLKDDLVGNFQKALLKSKAGVPVVQGGQTDLIVKFHITGGNFTAATAWNWQLVDVDTGAIVLSDSDTSAFGAGGETLANNVVSAIATIDTTVYGQPNNGIVVAQKKTDAPALAPKKSATNGENSWAVVIGVENYREGLAAATGAETDAKAFAEFAKTTMNVPEANTKVLLGDRASRADISGALLEWLPRNAVKPGGNVYVFFSGHGAPDIETGDSYLVPWDGNPTYIKSSGLRVGELQTQLEKLKGFNVYVFLDACFSGSGDRSVLPEGTRPIVPVKDIPAQGKVVTFTASGADETTGAHEGGTHGLFTYHLLLAISGQADANNDRDVTTGEVLTYLKNAVPTEARRQNRDQTPTGLNTGSQVLVDDLQ